MLILRNSVHTPQRKKGHVLDSWMWVAAIGVLCAIVLIAGVIISDKWMKNNDNDD